MVLLVTSDNVQFQVDKEVVERSVLIKNMLEGVPLKSLPPHRSNLILFRRWRDRSIYPFGERFL
jgi:hypothetical protein